jgi:hypothetical protein
MPLGMRSSWSSTADMSVSLSLGPPWYLIFANKLVLNTRIVYLLKRLIMCSRFVKDILSYVYFDMGHIPCFVAGIGLIFFCLTAQAQIRIDHKSRLATF